MLASPGERCVPGKSHERRTQTHAHSAAQTIERLLANTQMHSHRMHLLVHWQIRKMRAHKQSGSCSPCTRPSSSFGTASSGMVPSAAAALSNVLAARSRTPAGTCAVRPKAFSENARCHGHPQQAINRTCQENKQVDCMDFQSRQALSFLSPPTREMKFTNCKTSSCVKNERAESKPRCVS
eukprot:6185974-Pleurochrysis_carterae.AAC.1